MWRFLRKKKEVSIQEYASDLMAAIGKLPLQAEFIRYRVTPGITAEFDQWLLDYYQEWQRYAPKFLFEQLPLLNFAGSAIGESLLPMLGVVSPSKDASGRNYPFMLLRLLENPIAHEFQSVIPWLYRETFSSIYQLLSQPPEEMTLPALYKQVENLRFYNSRLKRRDALEAIIQQLRYMTFGHFWSACRMLYAPEKFIRHVTFLLRELKKRNYRGIRLPLPNHFDVMPTVIFWMQLLESVLGRQFQNWQVYWYGCHHYYKAAMVFYLDKVPPAYFAHIFSQQTVPPDIADALVIPNTVQQKIVLGDLTSSNQASMIKVLSQWGQVINCA